MATMSQAKPEPKALPKRFYAAVDVVQNAAAFSVTLDGKTIKTPAKKLLQVASHPLAQAIAEEWQAQREVIDTETMPLTRLASIAIDRVAEDREALLAEIAAYAETDLLCYRSPELKLQQCQAQHFDPVLDWVANRYGIELVTTQELLPAAQPAMSLARIAEQFAAARDEELAALAMLVGILGSTLLALAVWKERLTADQALEATRLDEYFQAEKWGMDPNITASFATKDRDGRACAFFLTCNRLN